MPQENNEILYPRLLRRVRAILIDSVILIAIFYSWMYLVNFFAKNSFWMNVGALVVPLIILDPVLVAFTGGTPGHHIMGLRVRDAWNDRNVNFFQALARFILRTLLGLFSFIFILISRRHQALHDYFTRSIVVLSHPELLPHFKKFSARKWDLNEFRYPSIWRRLIVIVCYLFLVVVVFSVLLMVVVSSDCMDKKSCSLWDTIGYVVSWLIWFISSAAAIVMGSQGRLWGCRRTPIAKEMSND